MALKPSRSKLTSDTWDLMKHWFLVLPPSRPSELQLERIKSQLEEIDRSAPVAVLGSTPEFRDLLHECGFQRICVLDRNLIFYQAMSESRVYRNPEYLVRGDWLETLGHLKGSFSVILSDLTSGNIPYEARRYFYELVTGALAPGGIFCDKVLTHPGPHLTMEALVDKYSRLPLNLMYVNSFNCEMLFCSELLDLEQVVNTTLFYSLLEKQIKNQRVRAFVGQTKLITPPGFTWWYGRGWQELEADYCPRLEVVAYDEDEPTSPYYRRVRFFALRKD